MPRDPLTPALRRGLRSEALALKARRVRGHVATTAWAGVPGAAAGEGDAALHVAHFDVALAPAGSRVDHGLRVEVTIALLHQVRSTVSEPLVWITRSGSPELCSPDLAWLSASRIACAELGLPHSFALVTREGWRHEPSGVTHRGKRLRG